MYKADYCLLCNYRDEAVAEIQPEYIEPIEYRRVDFLGATPANYRLNETETEAPFC